MSRISFRENGEEHNFWQNYTDLMSGFLIVFIITSLVPYGSYKVYVDLYHNKGITENNINDIVINADLYKKICEFQEAQDSINRKYFKYNKEYQRFECTVDVLFAPESPVIPPTCYWKLREAGKEVEEIVDEFKESTNVSFKVVIEGRAAKSHSNPNPSADQRAYAARLSYERARNLHLFWKKTNYSQTLSNKMVKYLYQDQAMRAKADIQDMALMVKIKTRRSSYKLFHI